MIRVLYRHRTGAIVTELSQEQIVSAARDPQARIWIDMVQPTADEYALILEKTFHFHPLAIEDAVSDALLPKADDYGSYLYLVFHTITLGDARMDLETSEIDVFLGPNYLVTIHHEERPSIDKLWRADHHEQLGLARGPAYVLYEMLDKQVDGYTPIIDHFEMYMEELGDELFSGKYDGSDAQMLNEILTAKSTALRLRRILGPQRDLLNMLSRHDYPALPAEARIYFRDVYDHLLRLSELSESMRDLASSTIETHLAMVNNRMNQVMKVLTIVSTVFIPLNFLAGVYGMNFDFMPELGWRWAYPVIWLVFISIASSLLLMFRRRKWI